MSSNDSLGFIKYDPDDIEQNLFLREIAMDKEISKYVDIYSNILASTNDNHKTIGVIVKDKNIGEYIGACVIKKSYYDLTAINLESAVHEKYRHTNKKYGTKMLSNITNILFEANNISRVVLEIKGDNIASIQTAINNNFSIDYELVELFYNEGYHYIPYSYYNKNYRHEEEYGLAKTKRRSIEGRSKNEISFYRN